MSAQRRATDDVVVARAQNQAEAEFVQGLLRAEGVPSFLRRTGGFDVPDFLAAGPRDVLVPASAEHVARDVLLQSRRDPGIGPRVGQGHHGRDGSRDPRRFPASSPSPTGARRGYLHTRRHH